MVSSVPAAASTPPSNGASSSGSCGNSGGAAASPESFLFSLLSIGAAAGAEWDASADGSLGFGKPAADSGNLSPSDGNVPPLSADGLSALLALLLNALPPQAGQASTAPSSVTDGEASHSSAAVSGTSSQDLLKQLAVMLRSYPGPGEVALETAGGASDGAALLGLDTRAEGATPVPAGLLRELMQAQSPDSGTNELPQALKEALARFLSTGKGAETTHAPIPGTASQTQATLSAAAAMTSASMGAVTAGSSQPLPTVNAETGSVLRQLLSSLKDSADVAGASARRGGDVLGAANAVIPATDTNSIVDALAARLDAVAANLNGAQTQAATPGIETRHLLREIGFDRASEASLSQASTVVPSHGLIAQPNNGTTPANAVPVLQLNTPMNRPEWADGLSDRIVWLSDQNLSNAQIRLNPPHLGPIEVSVSVSDDQTSVAFVAHHAATREALEAAAPRLREALSAHGLGTVNVNINQHSSSERSAQGQHYEAWSSFEPVPLEAASTAGPIRPASRALIDTYA